MKNLEKIGIHAKLSIDQLSVVVGGDCTDSSWTTSVCNNITGVSTVTHWNRSDNGDGSSCLSHWDEVIQ